MIADIDTLTTAPPDDTRDRRTVRIALLGCGTVGSAVARLLLDSRERLRETHGVDLQLARILVRETGKRREGVDRKLLTADFENILRDQPDVIIEALGGREPAATFVEHALRRGISVVSANKTLIARDGPRLRIAETAGAKLVYEASVGAAIPILAALRQRAGDPIVSLRAVLNGTCNFILSRMSESGLPLQNVLHEAVARGLAEPDPSADLSGRDSAEKLCILARALGFTRITPADIPTTGIGNVTPRDLQAAREHGCVIRLIAELEVIDDQPRLRVGPALVPVTHPLAKARSAENVIVLDQQLGGRLVLHGEGAGPNPTAAAILGDLLNAFTSGQPICVRKDFTTSHRARSHTPCFVRLENATFGNARVIVSRASHVVARRNAVEAIVEDMDAVSAARCALIAPLLKA